MSPGMQCAEEFLRVRPVQGDIPCYPFFVGWMLAKGFELESGQGREWDAFRDYLLAYADN